MRYTHEETLKYGTREELAELLSNYMDKDTRQQAENGRTIELMEEQLYFARELLENLHLEIEVKRPPGDFKKVVNSLISNCSLEY